MGATELGALLDQIQIVDGLLLGAYVRRCCRGTFSACCATTAAAAATDNFVIIISVILRLVTRFNILKGQRALASGD